jgi:hypothetical protein
VSDPAVDDLLEKILDLIEPYTDDQALSAVAGVAAVIVALAYHRSRSDGHMAQNWFHVEFTRGLMICADAPEHDAP